MSQEEPPEDPREKPLPAPQPGRKTKKSQLLIADYERLAQAYLAGNHRTVRALQAATGYSEDTCSRAIKRGWPERGNEWAPLRERAVIYDKQRIAEQTVYVPEQDRVDARKYRELREQNLMAAAALRAVARNLILRINEALPRSTANRHGWRTRVIEVKAGKRTVQKVVREDVEIPPYMPHLASALNSLGDLVKAVGDSERQWLGVEPPKGAEGLGGWDKLSDPELDAVIAGEGRLPAGMTLDQIRRGGPKPGA